MSKPTNIEQTIFLSDVIALFKDEQAFKFWYRDTKANLIMYSDPRMQTKARVEMNPKERIKILIDTLLQDPGIGNIPGISKTEFILMVNTAWNEMFTFTNKWEPKL